MNKQTSRLLIHEEEKTPIVRKPNFQKLAFDNYKLTILSDGSIPRHPIYPDFAPETSKEVLEQLLLLNGRSIETIDLEINTVLIEIENKKILLDVGLGKSNENPDIGLLVDSLALSGVRPDEITDIIISHLHPDHIGGLYGLNNSINYPNARIHLSELECTFWRNTQLSDFTESGIYHMDREGLKQIIQMIPSMLEDFKHQIEYIDFTKGLFGFLSFLPTPGHTPGMFSTKICSDHQSVTYIADLAHHELIQFEHPEWSFSGDHNPKLAAETRINFFHDFSNTQELVIGSHLPWPGIGRINSSEGENRFDWNPYGPIS